MSDNDVLSPSVQTSLLSQFVQVSLRNAELLSDLEQVVTKQITLDRCDVELCDDVIKITPRRVEAVSKLCFGSMGPDSGDTIYPTLYASLLLTTPRHVTELGIRYFGYSDAIQVFVEMDELSSESPFAKREIDFAIEKFGFPLGTEKIVNRAVGLSGIEKLASVFEAFRIQLQGGGAIIEGGF